MKATAELKMLPVSVLKPAAYNPRKKLKPGDKEYEKIKNSITEFGFADPLVVNADMTIIGGHQRLTVAMELGYTEVPCAVVDIDKTREKALNIALNKITGAWDDSLLADLLKDIEDSNFDLGKTGFEPPEIETLFNIVHSKEVKEDDFDVESELKQPCFSKEGDLWHLGKHIVLCGDSITKPSSRSPLHSRTQISRRSRMKPPLPRQKRISRWRSPMQRRKPRRLPLPQMHRQRQTANWQKACPIH